MALAPAIPSDAIAALGRYWWTFLLRGILAILFGAASFLQPGITLFVLVAFFGAWALVDGVLAVIGAFRARGTNERWWALLLIGLAGIAIGVITFVSPASTLFGLQAVVAAWSIAIGVFAIVAAIRLREMIEGEWVLGLWGVLSILFGLFVVMYPLASAIAMVWMLGGYAILFGILLIVLAFRLKGEAAHAPKRA